MTSDVQEDRLRVGIFFPFSKNKPSDIKLEISKTEEFCCCFLFTSLNYTKQHLMSYVYITDVNYL